MSTGEQFSIVSTKNRGPERPRNFVRLEHLRRLRGSEQVAAICYRLGKRGLEFLLVRTRGRRWTFPKGSIESGLTNAQAAALEAFEEAGVHGLHRGSCVCALRARKAGPRPVVERDRSRHQRTFVRGPQARDDPKKRIGSQRGFPPRRPSVGCARSVLKTTAKISRGSWIGQSRGFSGNIAASMDELREEPPR